MGALNIILSLAFVILFTAVGIVKNHLNSFIDSGIKHLEIEVDEIYPGALEKQMSTQEIKNILEESLNKKEVDGIEALAENIIKARIQKYTSSALKTIKAVERQEDRLSVKDALISIKELSIETASPYFKILQIALFVLYVALIIISILLSIHFANDKDSENKGIVFGEEADKTHIGMKTE
ncbi:MAG: hypothetical protein ACFNX0_07290 [Treponema sp.]